MRLELPQALLQLVSHGEEVGERGASTAGVPPPQVGEIAPAGLHDRQAQWVRVHAVDIAAELVPQVRQLGLHRPQATDELRERRAIRQRAQRLCHQIASAPFGAQGRLGGARGIAVGVGVREQELLGRQPGVLLGVLQPHPLDLVELKAQEVSLAGPGRHMTADRVYEKLTLEKGYFDTQIVFVDETGPKNRRLKRLTIMDQDGHGPRLLTDGKELTITPRFSPVSQEITYSQYVDGKPRVFLMNNVHEDAPVSLKAMLARGRVNAARDTAARSISSPRRSSSSSQITTDRLAPAATPSRSSRTSSLTFADRKSVV